MIRCVHPGVSVLLGLAIAGCGSFMNPSYDYDDVITKRSEDQSFIEDSLTVFFATYPNPYESKEVLWIASFIEGSVEMHIHDMGSDTLLAVYHFEPQEAPLYPVVYRGDPDRLVKCVVVVNGRPKCAKIFPWIDPLPHPQWGTRYTVEIPP